MGCCGSTERTKREWRPLEDRSCTDLPWFLLFTVFCVGMGSICGFSIVTGGAARLVFGYDSYGNTCGQRNEPIEGVRLSGLDHTDRKFVFFLDPCNIDIVQRKIRSLALCVSLCPSEELATYQDLKRFAMLNGSELCSYELAGHKYPGLPERFSKCPKLPVPPRPVDDPHVDHPVYLGGPRLDPDLAGRPRIPRSASFPLLPHSPCSLTLLFLGTTGNPVQNEETGLTEFRLTGPLQYLTWYHAVGLVWITEFILACQQMTVAGAVVTYYFTRDKNRLPVTPILSSVLRLVRYHLGTVAKGAFIITLVKIPRLILMYLHNQLKGKENACARCLLKTCICCLSL
ncbi:hypothetical protein PFLUV_G00127810 [Perca fluviatilis]|uniref:Choline transporter-like protein n=1 Tax=Perca fluviatilis TaxID=8168 RepID=A0A6A5FAT6_PERFL|nr:hypothetical protein PFLUV_G00127810 [Perca fluviatilis]